MLCLLVLFTPRSSDVFHSLLKKKLLILKAFPLDRESLILESERERESHSLLRVKTSSFGVDFYLLEFHS